MKTFWLVETSVSKYLLCTIQKEKKKNNVNLNWISDNTGRSLILTQRIVLFHVCS